MNCSVVTRMHERRSTRSTFSTQSDDMWYLFLQPSVFDYANQLAPKRSAAVSYDLIIHVLRQADDLPSQAAREEFIKSELKPHGLTSGTCRSLPVCASPFQLTHAQFLRSGH